MGSINKSSASSERLQPVKMSTPRAVPLSVLDATTANFAVTNAIWLFERPINTSRTVSELVDHLRQSLRRNLNSYPQFCGLLKSITSIDGSVSEEATAFPPHARRYGRLYAHYGTDDDPGVDFEFTESSMTLDLLSPTTRPVQQPLWNRHETPLGDFTSSANNANPFNPNNTDELGRHKSLLCIRVTFLSCGGMVLAAKSSHPLADITTLVRFIKDWAEVSRALLKQKDVPEVSRVFEPFRLNEMAQGNVDANSPDPSVVQLVKNLPLHRYDWWQASPGSPWPSRIPEAFRDADINPMGSVMPWAEWDVKEPVPHYTVHLNKSQVDHLWEQASLGSPARISRHDAVLAHIWACITRSRLPKDDNGPVHCNLTYGVRPSLKLDETYLGSPTIMINIELSNNVVASATPIAGQRNSNTISIVAQQIRRTLTHMSSADNVKAHIHNLAFEKSPQRIWQAFLGCRHIIVTTWARAGLYDIDFGFGGRIRYADGIIPDTDGVLLIKEAPGKDTESATSSSWTDNGVDVSVQIRKDDMERFLNDPLLLPACN